jgi:spore coat protein U-like protein
VRRATAFAVLILLVPATGARAAVCLVSATPVAFGTYLPFSGAPTDSTGTVTVTCFGSATISIALSTGGSGSFSSRQMTNGGAHLLYQLYANTTHTTVWGDGTGGTVTVTDTLTGFSNRNYIAYGRIPTLQTVRPGSYADTITVTVSY